jgi:hypothetical protein
MRRLRSDLGKLSQTHCPGLARDLPNCFGRGFSPDNLESMQAFDLTDPPAMISETVPWKSGLTSLAAAFPPPWPHQSWSGQPAATRDVEPRKVGSLKLCDPLCHMKAISIRELHATTGKWVRRATALGELHVTERGRVVAKLVPAAPPRSSRSLPAAS